MGKIWGQRDTGVMDRKSNKTVRQWGRGTAGQLVDETVGRQTLRIVGGDNIEQWDRDIIG
jgi:hypothetical protein